MGYMPRKKQAGFLFTSAIPNEYFAHTLAHELGHGAFRLEHTFSEYTSLSKGATDNLMDYGTGTRLNKYQWDYIHDPVAVLGLFEEDGEGEMMANTYFSTESLKLLLSQMREVNQNQEPSLDISSYTNGKAYLTHFALGDENLSFLQIKVGSIPVLLATPASGQSLEIAPSERNKEEITINEERCAI